MKSSVLLLSSVLRLFLIHHHFQVVDSRLVGAEVGPLEQSKPAKEILRASLFYQGEQSRRLQIVATTACEQIRTEPFTAQLDVFYVYDLGVVPDGDVADAIEGVHEAVLYSVVSALNQCGDDGAALYHIDASNTDTIDPESKFVVESIRFFLCPSNSLSWFAEQNLVRLERTRSIPAM